MSFKLLGFVIHSAFQRSILSDLRLLPCCTPSSAFLFSFSESHVFEFKIAERGSGKFVRILNFIVVICLTVVSVRGSAIGLLPKLIICRCGRLDLGTPTYLFYYQGFAQNSSFPTSGVVASF